MDAKKTNTLNRLYERAKGLPGRYKGKMSTYEEYKNEVKDLELEPFEYQQACRRLADILKV